MTFRLGHTVFAFAAIVSTAAHADTFRAYLTIDGNDANPCTLTLPCRLLPAALAAVADGGEIWMLDSANYNTGPVTVAKSVSIRAIPGAVGSLVSLGGVGASAINISASGLKVSLRNLSIVPVAGSSSYYGIYVTGASEVTIDGCVIENLGFEGVHVAGTGSLRVIDSVLRNIASWAIHAQAGASVSISGTKFLDSGGGVFANGSSPSTTTTVSVSDSVLTGSSSQGFVASAGSGNGVARMTITRSKMDYNSFAVRSLSSGTGTAVVSVSSSLISNNGVAWSQSGAGSTLYSLRDNHVADNTGTDSGTVTTLGAQ